MDSPKITYKYYSNPAFCAQSEVVFSQQAPCVSPRVSHSTPDRQRMPPLGANSPRKTPSTYERTRQNNNRIRTDISDNHLRIISPGNGPLRYIKDVPPELPPKPARFAHSRSSSVSSTIQRQRSITRTSKRSVNSSIRSRSEDLEMSSLSPRYDESDDCNKNSRTNHRYEVIRDLDDMADYSPTKKRIVESETDEYNVDAPDDSEFKAIPTEIVKTVNGKTLRYAIVPSDDEDTPKRHNVTFSSPPMSRKNLIATQKLHELLSTPRKHTLKSYASQPSIHMSTSPNQRNRSKESPHVYQVTPSKMTSTPKTMTPSKSCANLTLSPKSVPFSSHISPRAQQKLNYGDPEFSPPRQTQARSPDFFVTSRRERSFDRTLDVERRDMNRSLDLDRRDCLDDRREANRSLDLERREFNRSRIFERERRSPKKMERTAVITPRLAVQQAPSECSETATYKSWRGAGAGVGSATLAVAALMMTLCGALGAGLSFYMMHAVGRMYYLDFSVLSGFMCLLLGLLGFRSRTFQLLPNRNFISGYIVLSSFSLLSAAGLLVLLVARPPPGAPLADVTAGAVCALSALALCGAAFGALASCCCGAPPPDNRVGHAATWYR